MAEINLSEIVELKQKSLGELRRRYSELFGQESPSTNKIFLWRKIAYRLQELAYGGLSETAENKIQEMIRKLDPVNNKSLRPDTPPDPNINKRPTRDRRLPIPGTIITKEYKGVTVQVKILETGFEFNNRIYKSLSSIAKEVTGAHWNGYLFFNM